MQLIFKEDGHQYISDDLINWTSVTKVVENYCISFDESNQALISSQNVNSKWFGLDPQAIRSLWKAENIRSTDAGSWVHNKFEKQVLSLRVKEWMGKKLPVRPPTFRMGDKLATEQVLEDGVYPEHLLYNEKLHICGQSDIVIVCDGFVHIIDYKTNKKLEMQGYGWKYGSPSMMLSPVSHLEDCNFNHYVLQLGIYMRLVLLKNPQLKPGKIIIIHVEMEVDGYDEYQFPILKRTKDNGYAIKATKKYDCKYIETEVRSVLKDHYLNL